MFGADKIPTLTYHPCTLDAGYLHRYHQLVFLNNARGFQWNIQRTFGLWCLRSLGKQGVRFFLLKRIIKNQLVVGICEGKTMCLSNTMNILTDFIRFQGFFHQTIHFGRLRELRVHLLRQQHGPQDLQGFGSPWKDFFRTSAIFCF